MPPARARSNPRSPSYDASADQAAAAWEAARHARRSATIAWWAVAATLIAAAFSTVVPLATQTAQEHAADDAALRDELDQANTWVLAAIQADNDHLSRKVSGELAASGPIQAGPDKVLAYAWERRLSEGRQRLAALATQPPPKDDLRDLRRAEANQIEQVQAFVDYQQGRAVGSDEGQLNTLLDISSKGLAQMINRIEASHGRPARYDADQWPLVDRATAAHNLPNTLRKLQNLARPPVKP